MDKLAKLLALCKCGVYIEINAHRDAYQTVEQRLDDSYRHFETTPEVEPAVLAKMKELDTIVDLQFYPHTPIGSYQILHYDLDAALDEALATFKLE